MKLVIEIDDEHYATITNKVKAIRNEASKNGYANNDVVPIGWVSIADGAPLPNGYGRLIDADLFVHDHPLAFVRDVINDAPTIIEADGGEDDEEKVSD